jgi:hypothetical protein
MSPAVARPEIGKAKRIHPYAWLWEPLEPEPSFVLRSMFGTKAAYLEGKLVLCFSSGKEPWNGLLVATDRERQAPLVAEFPGLKPHPILPKWLYLSDSSDAFEPTAERLVELARQRDPRIGVFPQERKRKGRSAGPA